MSNLLLFYFSVTVTNVMSDFFWSQVGPKPTTPAPLTWDTLTGRQEKKVNMTILNFVFSFDKPSIFNEWLVGPWILKGMKWHFQTNLRFFESTCLILPLNYEMWYEEKFCNDLMIDFSEFGILGILSLFPLTYFEYSEVILNSSNRLKISCFWKIEIPEFPHL